ncbi:MAG: hypothetical protein IJX46_03155, partial [Clostridia bacterium]|nr:hypothetical protein [Clostridia bacterium]
TQKGGFRALRRATGVSAPAPEKLLKKFYQNFQRGVRLRPSNSDLLLASPFFRCYFSCFAVFFGKIILKSRKKVAIIKKM